MSGMPEKPVITFILVTYNQEKYIREAVAAAFAQTYSPLEIILSDDCSLDHTFEIMQEMAATYQGPHKIILNRNPKNLRLCGNFNKALELSQGELIVGAAGDDISLPQRCSRLAEEWLKPGRRWHSICSNAEVIDEAGNRYGRYQNWESYREIASVDEILATGIVGIAGCTHAFSRQTYEVFGPLDEKAFGEDEMIGFRSLILGGACWIPDRLILYRRHSENLFNDAAGLKKKSRPRRKQIMEKYLQDCLLGVEIRKEALRLAVQKGILTQKKAEYYVKALQHSFPSLQFMVYYNKQRTLAAGWLIWAILSGRYRLGMFSLFEHTHLPNGLRQLLRACRKPLMAIRK
jgi:glycosyltransferase involved in cell wall biosynthesis